MNKIFFKSDVRRSENVKILSALPGAVKADLDSGASCQRSSTLRRDTYYRLFLGDWFPTIESRGFIAREGITEC